MTNHLPSGHGYMVFVIMVRSKEAKRPEKCKLSPRLPHLQRALWMDFY